MSLYGGHGYSFPSLLSALASKRRRGTYEEIPACLGVSLANVLIFSLTTEIPRSSDALSSNTLARNRSGLQCQLEASCRIVRNGQLTHKADVRGRGWYSSFLFQADRRTTYVGATSSACEPLKIFQLTFVETRALRSTSTVFSCDETSSIVLGRLKRQLRFVALILPADLLFLDPWLQLGIYRMRDWLCTECCHCCIMVERGGKSKVNSEQ